MAGCSASDYEALLEEARKGQKRAEEEREREVELRKQAEEQQRRAEEQQRQAEEQRQQAEKEREHEAGLREQAEERTRETTFDEYMAACHSLLSVPLRVACPSRSTKGSIPAPTGKYCPTRFREWTDFDAQQTEVYNTVRSYLQPADVDAPRLFSPLLALQDLGRSLCSKPLSSEKDLEGVERYGKDRHVHDVVSALCQIPAAREELRLGRGFRFDSHANALDEEAAEVRERNTTSGRMQPDQFCVHRLDGDSSTLLMTVEYKPPHKLSTENLCAGLRPMEFWEEVVNSETIPTGKAEKLRYNAARLTGAALVQEYHVMIQEGLAYSCLSTGIALVFLYVPEDEPTTLYYHVCVPNEDVRSMGERSSQQPVTAVARLLCLGLMSCATSLRSNAWRNRVKGVLHVWETNFEHARSQIPDEQLYETPPGSEYIPSSPVESPEEDVRGRNTRLHPVCTPSPGVILDRRDSSDSSDLDPDVAAPRHKRNYSQVASPPQPQDSRSTSSQQAGGYQRKHVALPYCTQKCLLGLKQDGPLDNACPNVSVHRRSQQTDKHLVTAVEMVHNLKQQLDNDVDHHCEPFGECGRTGAPFKLHCESYGYTFVGKGTTSSLWNIVSREAEFYQVLGSAQGSTVPVYLGSIDMAQSYFRHKAGEIQHMLLMAWGGEPLTESQWKDKLPAVRRSLATIHELGVHHGDVRRPNTLWNSELNGVLIIDFDKSFLTKRQTRMPKRDPERLGNSAKRPRLMA
jgi:chemotaxis protein histidine kinase CheA